jgi:hypothetical protein
MQLSLSLGLNLRSQQPYHARSVRRKARYLTLYARGMSRLGQSRRFCDVNVTSAIPLITAVKRTSRIGGFGPTGDIEVTERKASAQRR